MRSAKAAGRRRAALVLCSSRRRHTGCYRDWSSDVCSSDLLAVDLDSSPAQPVHEATVGQLVQPGGGVDPNDPEPAEIALLATAVAVGVLLGPLHRLLGGLPQLRAPAKVPLGELHDLVFALQARNVALDAGHSRSLRHQEALAAPLVGVR